MADIRHSFSDCIRQLKSKALEICYENYLDYSHIDYNILIIENLMCNGRCHLVAVFKNYLIEDDKSEYLRRFYKKKELGPRLKKLFKYHQETSVIFPNYVPLSESKYLYNNVIKKQRVIDEQQSLDKLRKENKNRKLSLIKKEDRMFNSTICGEILASNQSVLRIVFGLDYNKNENKTEKNIKQDESDCEDFDKLINEVEKAEENANNIINNNSLEAFHLTNKASKYKLKLVNKLNSNNNIQVKNKNTDKLYNITNNNSTNITSSSNPNTFNINNNTNLNKYKSNNLLLKENSLQNNINFKTNKKQKNYNLNKTSPNKKLSDDKNENLSRNIQTNINSITCKTLYGMNFHTSNKIINNLINKEKKVNLKSKSNSNHYHNQNSQKFKTHIFNNDYIYNSNFPQSHQNLDRNNFYSNKNNKLNLVVKSYNDVGMTNIPKIDMNRVKQMNKSSKINNLNSNTNRNINRNNNYILNNPNLFFTETDVLKSERNLMRKKNLKKNNIKTKFGPVMAFSPLKLTSKILVGKNNNNSNLILVNEKIFKSMNHRNAKINHYFSNNTSNNMNANQNLYKTKKNLVINEYNYKAVSKKNNDQNYFNIIFNK